MRKIYILTYHCAYNVGAMLQCYALSKAIENCGYQAAVIDYRPEKIRNNAIEAKQTSHANHKLKRSISEAIHLLYRLIKYLPHREKHIYIYGDDTASSFSKFMTKYLPLTSKTFYNEKELKAFSEETAIFITGSDQVWNPALSKTPKAYLLDFVKTGKKNSYAASFGKKSVDKEYEAMLQESLSDFNIISVREKSGVEIVRKAAQKEAYAVLDPVFLLDFKLWKTLTYKVKIPVPYIFVYRMEPTNEAFIQINKLKEKNPNLRVVKFDDIDDALTADYIIDKKGPTDFLSYLFGSTYVVTNSFHGTAFSLIARKNATVIPHSKYNERIDSLLAQLNVGMSGNIYELDDECYEKLGEAILDSKVLLIKICEEQETMNSQLL